jgi:hypothetical protein
MTCGIYQITNKVNGKFYIGQSRNISKRWRQHTGGLDKPDPLSRGSYPLRAAFLKYGLEQFEFEVIEQCSESQLLTREAFWISERNPAYNCNIKTPVRKPNSQKRTEPRAWVQYHNYEKLGYLPAELNLDFYPDKDYVFQEDLACISTGKRDVLDAVGDPVFLIVGVGFHAKQYYLWYRFTIEEILVSENADRGKMPYDAFGSGHFVDPPQLLNSDEFSEFQKHCGNFGFGFMNIANSPYLKTLEALSEQHRIDQVDFPQYVETFFKQVTEVNPDEVAAYAQRGIARHLAVSMYPEQAVCLLTGTYNKLVIFGISPAVVNYRGKLLLHTLGYYDDIEDPELQAEYKAGSLQVVNAVGLNEDTFPGHAIQGWVNVVDVVKYDAESFAADQDDHGQGDNLAVYRDELYLTEEAEAWCFVVSEPVFLEKAIKIAAPPETYEADPWFPELPEEIEAFRDALNQMVVVEAVAE